MQEMPLVLTIRNDGKGTQWRGNYDVTLEGPQLFVQARVEDYERKRGWHALVREAVDALEIQGKEE